MYQWPNVLIQASRFGLSSGPGWFWHGRRRRQALLLIGNNQAENPWLEESLATFGDGIAGGDAIDYATATFRGASSVCWGNR